MGVDLRDSEKMVQAVGAGAAKVQDGLVGPKPENGGSGSGSSPSQCDEPEGDNGITSVNPSPRLPCSSAAIDEEDERDAEERDADEEQAAIASIILQLSQQPPVAKRRRVRKPPGGAHADHHEITGSQYGRGGGGDEDARRSRSSWNASGGRATAAASRPASQPPTPQPPPSTLAGVLPGIPSFANFPDPVSHGVPLHHTGHAHRPPLPLPLPPLSLTGGMQGNTLPALLPHKDAGHSHLPPPPEGLFQAATASSSSQSSSLYPFPLAPVNTATPIAGRTSSAGGGSTGGGGGGDAWAGDENVQGNGDSPMSTPRDGESGDVGAAGAAGGNRTTEVRRAYRCSKCGAEKKGHLCSAKLAANMMPATPVKRIDLAARLAARLHAGTGEGGDGMDEGRGGLQANDLSNLPFFRSFRAEEVYGDAVMNHPALASGLPVLMKCPPGEGTPSRETIYIHTPPQTHMHSLCIRIICLPACRQKCVSMYVCKYMSVCVRVDKIFGYACMHTEL